jgi:hypothetical protein
MPALWHHASAHNSYFWTMEMVEQVRVVQASWPATSVSGPPEQHPRQRDYENGVASSRI